MALASTGPSCISDSTTRRRSQRSLSLILHSPSRPVAQQKVLVLLHTFIISPKGTRANIPSTPPPTYPLDVEPVVLGDSPEPELMERPPVYSACRSNKGTPPSSIDDMGTPMPTTQPPTIFLHPEQFPIGIDGGTQYAFESFHVKYRFVGSSESYLGRTKSKVRCFICV